MTEGSREIEFLYDVELELSVVLGNSQMLIRDLLQLKTGSVVELKKLAGESLASDSPASFLSSTTEPVFS